MELLYLLCALPLIALEIYAIKTNKYDTISELVWKAGKWHWFIRVLTAGLLIWAFIHLVVGECAFGIC